MESPQKRKKTLDILDESSSDDENSNGKNDFVLESDYKRKLVTLRDKQSEELLSSQISVGHNPESCDDKLLLTERSPSPPERKSKQKSHETKAKLTKGVDDKKSVDEDEINFDLNESVFSNAVPDSSSRSRNPALQKKISQKLQNLEMLKSNVIGQQSLRSEVVEGSRASVYTGGPQSKGSDVDAQITIRVRVQNRVLKFFMDENRPMSDLFLEIAQLKKVPLVSLTLLLKDDQGQLQNIKSNQSPKEIGLSAADIIDCKLQSSNLQSGDTDNAAATSGSANGSSLTFIPTDCVRLKFQTSQKKETISMIVNLSHSFKLIRSQYCEECHLEPGRQLSFRFDDEQIEDDATPESLDLENDDCIDVVIR